MDGRGRWMDNVFIERIWRSHLHDLMRPRMIGHLVAHQAMDCQHHSRDALGSCPFSDISQAELKYGAFPIDQGWQYGCSPSTTNARYGKVERSRSQVCF
jgi:hypothetical protein